MKEVKLNLYRFDELSDDAKKDVIERYRDKCGELHTEAWEYEYKATLDKFSEIIGIKVYNWEVDSWSYGHNYRWVHEPTSSGEMDHDDVRGKYLLRFLNRIYFDVRSRKYHSTPFTYDENGKPHYRYLYSKILWHDGDCPLTGFCADYSILEPIWDWHKEPDWKISVDELVTKCLDKFFEDWQNDIRWGYSDEYVEEELSTGNLDDKWFYQDGSECCVPAKLIA